MDWERKFSSIVAETEANLAKAKQKLKATSTPQYNNRWTSEKYNLGFDSNSSLWADHPLSSTRLHQGSGASFAYVPDELSLPRPSDSMALSVYPHTHSPGLHGMMEEQRKTIGKLTKLVQDLEEERGIYQRQIEDLKREMNQISSVLLEQRSGSRLDRQLERLKREVSYEVQGIREALEHSVHRSDLAHMAARNPNLAFRDLLDVKEDMHEEMTYIKKDIASLRSRLENIEFGMSCHSLDGRARPYEKDNRLNRSLYESSRPLRSVLPPGLSTSLPVASADRLQLDHIRSTVSSMKTKLDDLDSRLNATHAKQLMANGVPWKQLKTRQKIPSLDLDDLSLSDDDDDDDFDDELSTAFEFEKVSTRHSYQQQKDEIDDVGDGGDDDLDLDDLDLSEEDVDDKDLNPDYNIEGDLKDIGDTDVDIDDDISLDSAELADIDNL